MQRMTLTFDHDLVSSLDRYMEASGHQNRSEVVRDLLRASLAQQSEIADDSSPCVAALVYVYELETRNLAQRLMSDYHKRSDLSTARMNIAINSDSCLEVSMLRGQTGEVKNFAQKIIAERGVRHGQLITVPGGVE